MISHFHSICCKPEQHSHVVLSLSFYMLTDTTRALLLLNVPALSVESTQPISKTSCLGAKTTHSCSLESLLKDLLDMSKQLCCMSTGHKNDTFLCLSALRYPESKQKTKPNQGFQDCHKSKTLSKK